MNGKLPVTAAGYHPGDGVTTEKTRLETILPEEMGLPSSALNIIDSIAQAGIRAHAYPGCQVLLAKNGRIFYEKAFGRPEYEDSVAVNISQLYDVASVTKVAATTLSIMKLYDQGKLSLTDSLGKYLPILKGSNKASLKIGDVMAHQAGLLDWIPFYKSTLVNSGPDPAIYHNEKSDGYSTEVAAGLWIRNSYKDTILKKIINSPLRAERNYKYSDLGFYLLRMLTEKLTGLEFSAYLDKEFYKPLGLTATTFNPLENFPKERIIPTENDREFRKQLIRGYVHDPGAAMLGGVSGHAGLFSNAGGLAVILQMLLNEGSYGGKEYFSPATVRKFTQAWDPASGNRRGIGFDRPLKNFDPDGPSCKSASLRSFGHSGFTGTYLWADPENQLIYIFLSNRVCPDAGNQKLAQMNIRTEIHQAAYNLLQKFKIK